MAIHLSKLQNCIKSAVIPVEIEDGTATLNLRYLSPAPKHVQDARTAAKTYPEHAADIHLLSRVLLEWDFVGEDDDALPITKETLEALPHTLLNAIWQIVMNTKPTKASH